MFPYDNLIEKLVLNKDIQSSSHSLFLNSSWNKLLQMIEQRKSPDEIEEFIESTLAHFLLSCANRNENLLEI